jgi:hypothetical protein
MSLKTIWCSVHGVTENHPGLPTPLAQVQSMGYSIGRAITNQAMHFPPAIYIITNSNFILRKRVYQIQRPGAGAVDHSSGCRRDAGKDQRRWVRLV